MASPATFAAAASRRAVPTPVPRSPLVLPTCGSCPTPTSYDQVLPWTPPQTRDYLRGNFWGIPIAGLPWVPGITSSKHPERFLSYLWGLYPDALQEQWIDEVLTRAYTHALMSWPNWRTQVQRPLAAFVAEIVRMKAAGIPYVKVMLGAKGMDPQDQTLAQWQASLDPVMDACAGVADEYGFWEFDSFNVDGQSAIDIHCYFGQRAHAQGASFWAHFYPAHADWDPLGRFHFWQALGTDVDGLDYQGDPSWDIGELQARSVDILNQFAADGHKLRQFEPGTPTLMFDGDHPTEDEADAFGFLSVCTKAAAFPWGFGAGGRQRNGGFL